jgi:hypothetical protein
MKMDITETKLFKQYPRVAPTADLLGFTVDDIELLLNKIRNDSESNRYFDNDDIRQTALKVIFVRLDLSRDDFFKHINTRKSTDPDLSNECGLFNVKAYKAILK